MTRPMALARIIFGFVLLVVMYAGPYAYGRATAGGKLAECLQRTARPTNVVVKLGFIPGPSQIQEFQRYGRYGGSGGDLENVVLLGVPPQNIQLLAELYWVDRVDPADGC